MPDSEMEWPDLAVGEEILTEPNELVWRQVHPQRIQNGRVSSDAFMPGSNDAKQLSCSRASKVSSEDAHRHHTEVLNLASAGSAVVSVSEIESARPIIDGNPEVPSLRAIDDTATSTEDDPLPPGHTYLDYRPFGSSRISKKAKQLAFYANKRGVEEF